MKLTQLQVFGVQIDAGFADGWFQCVIHELVKGHIKSVAQGLRSRSGFRVKGQDPGPHAGLGLKMDATFVSGVEPEFCLG